MPAARCAFAKCQFDEQSCAAAPKRLRAYRKEWDDERGVWRDRPRHDDASHGADAFLTFACSGYTPPAARSRSHRKIDYGQSAWAVSGTAHPSDPDR